MIRSILLLTTMMLVPAWVQAEVTLVKNGQVAGEVVVDLTGASPADQEAMLDAASWLVRSLESACDVALPIRPSNPLGIDSAKPTILLRLADQQNVAGPDNPHLREAYEISTAKGRVQIQGRSGVAVRHGVAALLRHLGFRFFAPSPKWHHIPALETVTIDLQMTDSPALRFRRIWYAYGVPGEDLKALSDNYRRWVMANQLSLDNIVQCGHSYGNIVGRNQEIFDQHPEYFALREDGKRDIDRVINARKFCFSNPGLIQLVCDDRVRLLKENQQRNPSMKMVSVDPSDGPGTCHCDACAALGTPTDRVFHLANAVARAVANVDPEAWVGLYAYSSHRLPPTIDVQPNVYVQVAMGFNRTQYSFTELVDLWAKKVTAIGLREYYGVQAWDWGLPGRMRGGQAEYHRKWIPYYAARNLDAVNAETNSNWGGQTLGLYIASRLLWDPDRDTEADEAEFFELCFQDAAAPMRRVYEQFDRSPQLRAASLLPIFDDVKTAWRSTRSAGVRSRLTDIMAYLVYVARFREFDLVRSRQPSRNDAYYQALQPLMNYAWRIRHRDMVHYYALARRLCNGYPLQDGKDEFWFARKEQPPVWMNGPSYSDKEIVDQFASYWKQLAADEDPSVAYSRLLDPLVASGDDAGPSMIAGSDQMGVARFRGPLVGYLLASGKQTITIGIAPTSRQATIVVSARGRDPIFEATFRQSPSFQTITIELPSANEYKVTFQGDFALRVDSETPFVYEASITHPAWIDYSGPHYFFVPTGCKELCVDASPRWSIFAPGSTERIDVTRLTRIAGKDYSTIKVPDGADGLVWHTSAQTRGKFALLNVPPLLSLYRGQVLRPREVADGKNK